MILIAPQNKNKTMCSLYMDRNFYLYLKTIAKKNDVTISDATYALLTYAAEHFDFDHDEITSTAKQKRERKFSATKKRSSDYAGLYYVEVEDDRIKAISQNQITGKYCNNIMCKYRGYKFDEDKLVTVNNRQYCSRECGESNTIKILA